MVSKHYFTSTFSIIKIFSVLIVMILLVAGFTKSPYPMEHEVAIKGGGTPSSDVRTAIKSNISILNPFHKLAWMMCEGVRR